MDPVLVGYEAVLVAEPMKTVSQMVVITFRQCFAIQFKILYFIIPA
jgi:hypothetical protein